MHRILALILPVLPLLVLAPSHAAASVSDVGTTINANGPAYIAPNTSRTITVTVRNTGPDTAENPVVVSAEYLIFPIGEIQINPANEGTPCNVQFTDFTMPSGQRLEIVSFPAPALPRNGSYSCTLSILALARGRQAYTLRLGVNDIAPGSIDPNPTNNIAEFGFVFTIVTQILTLSVLGATLLIGFIVFSTKRHLS